MSAASESGSSGAGGDGGEGGLGTGSRVSVEGAFLTTGSNDALLTGVGGASSFSLRKL